MLTNVGGFVIKSYSYKTLVWIESAQIDVLISGVLKERGTTGQNSEQLKIEISESK